MTVIKHFGGLDQLPEACVQTILDPEVAIGIVDTGHDFNGVSHDDVGAALGVEALAMHMNKAWQQAGYLGVLSAFEHTYTTSVATKPHIDSQKGSSSGSPPRVAVISMPLYGVGHLHAISFKPLLKPGETFDTTQLRAAQWESYRLTTTELPLKEDIHPGQAVIIPTLPTPTAHSVTIPTGRRLTDLWDCVLSYPV